MWGSHRLFNFRVIHMHLLHPPFKGDNQKAMILTPESEFKFRLEIVATSPKKMYGCGPPGPGQASQFSQIWVIIRRDDGWVPRS